MTTYRVQSGFSIVRVKAKNQDHAFERAAHFWRVQDLAERLSQTYTPDWLVSHEKLVIADAAECARQIVGAK